MLKSGAPYGRVGENMAKQDLHGGSRLLDSLLYDEEPVSANLWLDDDFLLTGDGDPQAERRPRGLWAVEAPQPWYRWRGKTA